MTTSTNVIDEIQRAGVAVETAGHRVAAYAYDASNFRITPLGVVFPRDVEDVRQVLAACHVAGVSIVARGGGTSTAGSAVGPGIVLDFSRHMNRIHSVDAGAGTIDVDPGCGAVSSLARG